MVQYWDYGLIIAQTALAVSVLTAWHDGFASFIKKATVMEFYKGDAGGIDTQNLLFEKNRICQYFGNKLEKYQASLVNKKILLRFRSLTKVISLGLVILFIVYCYEHVYTQKNSPLEIEWTHLAWLPFAIWGILLLISWGLNFGMLYLRWISPIETKALLNWNEEKVNTLPSTYEKASKGNKFCGFFEYLALVILLLPLLILVIIFSFLYFVFVVLYFLGRLLFKFNLILRFKDWIDSLCAHKPACPLCNQTDTCNKGNCNMCHSNANSLIFNKKEVNQNNFENISDSSITQPLTITAPCPKEGYQIVCTISCNSVKESNT